MNCIQSYKQERPSTNYRGSSYPYNYFRNEDYKPSYTKRITDYYSQQSNDMFADLEDTNERYCSTCMVEVKTDEHEISDSKYYCEICCNHFTESEVMK